MTILAINPYAINFEGILSVMLLGVVVVVIGMILSKPFR